MQNRLISIIIPIFNRASLLSETLDSILAQTYSHWECIIVDDGSTDNTQDVIDRYLKLDSRFRCFSRPSNRPKGANACRNFGYEKSKGEFINWFDSDDIMLPDFLKIKIEAMLQNSCLEVVFSYGAYFSNNDPTQYEVSKPAVENIDILNFVKGEFYLSTPGPLWRRSFLVSKALFDEYRNKIQDVEFHFRMILEIKLFKFYDKTFLFLIRRGVNRVSSKAHLNNEKLLDIFNYYYFTYQNSINIDYTYLEEYRKTTINKSLKSLYELLVYNKTVTKRMQLYKENSQKLETLMFGLSYKKKSKLYAGFFGLIFFRRGYFLLRV